MEILRFTLSGKHACFRKPEVNSYYYYTYGNIHRVALLGIFGAILGYGGYSQIKDFAKKKKRGKEEITYTFPEFYDRLQGLKISILPGENNSKGYIPKKVQMFNNSVGYASREQGGNLIVKEQWLENPQWEIAVLIDSEEAENIKKAICGRKCVYYPYLGKNDHMADISNIKVEAAEETKDRVGRLACFVPEDMAFIADMDYDEREELDAFGSFKYEESLPWGLDGYTNLYMLRKFMYTDEFMEVKDEHIVYSLSDGKHIVFY